MSRKSIILIFLGLATAVAAEAKPESVPERRTTMPPYAVPPIDRYPPDGIGDFGDEETQPRSIKTQDFQDIELDVQGYVIRRHRSIKPTSIKIRQFLGGTTEVQDSGSPALPEGIKDWNRKLSESLFIRIDNLFKMAYPRTRIKPFQITYVVKRDGSINVLSIKAASDDKQFKSLLVGVTSSLRGNQILRFPLEVDVHEILVEAEFDPGIPLIGDFGNSWKTHQRAPYTLLRKNK